jgi:hypothetical protein
LLVQGAATLLDASMAFTRLGEASKRVYDDLRAPVVPPASDCVEVGPSSPEAAENRIIEGTRILLDPATIGWSRDEPSGVAEVRGWAELADGEPVGPLSLLFLLDCLPPATFEISSKGWVPTLQLTSYVRALPAPGPVKIRQRAQVVSDGFVDEVCEIWDATDRLVAQAVQLAKVRF